VVTLPCNCAGHFGFTILAVARNFGLFLARIVVHTVAGMTILRAAMTTRQIPYASIATAKSLIFGRLILGRIVIVVGIGNIVALVVNLSESAVAGTFRRDVTQFAGRRMTRLLARMRTA
jgi:hypothetical protein